MLVKENVPRNRWALAQPAMMATSGKSRSAWQQRKQENDGSLLDQPIHRLVLLVEAQECSQNKGNK